jgi:hypothetical protein
MLMSASLNHTRNAPAASPQAVLIVTATDGIDTTAAALASHLGLTVEIAASRAAALRLLARRGYAAVILDQILADSDPDGCDLIWKNAGIAVPLQINFAFAGSARLEREIRGALTRREREQQLAMAAATAAIDAELKNAITGFLLESRLALAERNIPPQIENRLQTLVEMANRLRDHLQPTVPEGTTTVSLLAPQK